ncbi:MAG: polysaccharide deacetylase family protein [Ferruginibacter sp.]|nr:polysaccharide deacetylase family protein [Ferruginibacter sp.]
MTAIAPHFWQKRKKSIFNFLKRDLYFVKTPWWIKKLYSNCVWDIKTNEKVLYITFDDGPHPTITPFVLQELNKYNAKATFFLIGDNAKKYPTILQQIIDEGHAIGNHTMHHLNGWKTSDEIYVNDIKDAEQYISSNLFRPPYGRISKKQIQALTTHHSPLTIIMWNILAGDWEQSLSPQKCFNQIKNKIYPGAIVVFHDSEKAKERMKFAFSKLLQYAAQQGYSFKSIVA